MDLVHHRVGSGDPLVLIHGIGSRWQMWQPVIPALAEHFEVVALDLPGFGASAMPPPGTPAGVGSLTSLVARFLEAIGLRRPHVAGNSLGGLVALELGRRGMARSVTGVSPAGFALPWENAQAHTRLRAMVRTARAVAPWTDRLLASRLSRRLAMASVAARPGHVSVREAVDSVQALAGAPWFDETLRAVGAMEFMRGGGGTIDVPVTIAWGEKDRILAPRQALRAARLLPWARVVWLSGCGHVPTYDDPEQVARVLIEAATADRWRPAAADR